MLLHVVINKGFHALVALAEGVIVAACYASPSESVEHAQEMFEALSECRKGK